MMVELENSYEQYLEKILALALAGDFAVPVRGRAMPKR
jgi:hypothetical protein